MHILEPLYVMLINARRDAEAKALRTLLDTVKVVDYADDGNTRFIFLPGLTREHVTIQRNGGEITVPGMHLIQFIS
jgi:hypothetical protein